MPDDPTFRDELALDRTVLANERTFLAYCRTSLALAGIAILIFKFATPRFAEVGGWSVMAAALELFCWGLYEFVHMSHAMQHDHATKHVLVTADTE